MVCLEKYRLGKRDFGTRKAFFDGQMSTFITYLDYHDKIPTILVLSDVFDGFSMLDDDEYGYKYKIRFLNIYFNDNE